MIDSEIDRVIRQAIAERRLVEVVYLDRKRIVEPHDYGIHKGTVKLLAYQVDGLSSGPLPNWRWMEFDRIAQVQMLDRTFRGGRGRAGQKHHDWDELFARVEPAED